MYQLQLSLWRSGISPEEGQKMLALLKAKTQSSDGAGVSKVNVPGVTVDENPFPKWLQEALLAQIPGLKLSPVNMMYIADFVDQADAEAAMQWVIVTYRQWAATALTNEQNEVLGLLVARVLANADISDVAGLEEF